MAQNHSNSEDKIRVGGYAIPTVDVAKQYALEQHLLQTVTSTLETDLYFEMSGPRFQMVTGKDANGDDKYIWLAGGNLNDVKVVSQILVKDGISEQAARKAVESKGEIRQLIVAPMIMSPFRERGVIAWYIQFTDNSIAYVDFKTGQIIDINARS